MSKAETIRKVSVKLTSRINLGRRAARDSGCLNLDIIYKPSDGLEIVKGHQLNCNLKNEFIRVFLLEIFM